MDNLKQIEVLNDLVQINNDRLEGYVRAIGELKETDQDLLALFKNMADQSRDYNTELAQLIDVLGGEPASGTSGAGKVYRVWMDVKALLTGGDRKTILENCENGEAAALRAYAEALEDDSLVPELRTLVLKQQGLLTAAQNQINALRKAI